LKFDGWEEVLVNDVGSLLHVAKKLRGTLVQVDPPHSYRTRLRDNLMRAAARRGKCPRLVTRRVNARLYWWVGAVLVSAVLSLSAILAWLIRWRFTRRNLDPNPLSNPD
jgi:hypothetical protein